MFNCIKPLFTTKRLIRKSNESKTHNNLIKPLFTKHQEIIAILSSKIQIIKKINEQVNIKIHSNLQLSKPIKSQTVKRVQLNKPIKSQIVKMID